VAAHPATRQLDRVAAAEVDAVDDAADVAVDVAIAAVIDVDRAAAARKAAALNPIHALRYE
jgi:hypothetical protein